MSSTHGGDATPPCIRAQQQIQRKQRSAGHVLTMLACFKNGAVGTSTLSKSRDDGRRAPDPAPALAGPAADAAERGGAQGGRADHHGAVPRVLPQGHAEEALALARGPAALATDAHQHRRVSATRCGCAEQVRCVWCSSMHSPHWVKCCQQPRRSHCSFAMTGPASFSCRSS